MRFSRSVYFYVPAILTECSLFLFWLAEPIYIRQKLGGSAVDVGILGTANGGLYAVLAFVVGMMCQRCDKRRMALFGGAIQIPAALALPFCNDLTTFMTICILHNGLFFLDVNLLCCFSTTSQER